MCSRTLSGLCWHDIASQHAGRHVKSAIAVKFLLLLICIYRLSGAGPRGRGCMVRSRDVVPFRDTAPGPGGDSPGILQLFYEQSREAGFRPDDILQLKG